MAYLVTGVGYIGAKLVEDLLDAGEVVVGVDNLFSTDRKAIERLCRRPTFHFVRGSVARRETLARAFAAAPIQTVFALAAQASAHPGAASARYTEITNLLSPRLLLDEAVARGVRTVVYASSMHVYGHIAPSHAAESSPYGRFGDLSHLSKVYVEKLLEMYAGRHRLRCVPVRLGLVYGLSPVMKTDYRFVTVPNKFCLQAVRGETLVVNEEGMRPLALLHVADAARALSSAAVLPDDAAFCPVNAATEIATVLDVARMVVAEATRVGLHALVAAPTLDAVDAADHGTIPSRLAEAGLTPTRSLADGVRETLAYFSACATQRGRV